MFRKHMMLVIGLLVVASMVLAACGGGDTTTDVPATDVVVTDVPVVPQTTRVGGWADQLIFTSNPDSENAISQLSAGEIDVYAMSMSEPALYEAVRSDPNLAYSTSVGTYDAFHFNTIPFADGRLNPFVYVEIREAMHWLVDRNFLIQEYLGGLGLAKYTAFTVAFPDYARYIADIRAMEAKYAYNPDKANAAITAKMEELGSTKNADGKWLDPTTGEPVVIIGIIRVEDERQQFGIYLAQQLETVGFTVDQQLKTRTEASPIWRGDPTLGLWNYYTAGWINNYIARDEGSNFDFYYTTRGYPDLWQTMRTVDPTLDAISLRLATADYTTPEERDQLVSEILPMGTRDNSIMLLVDTQSFQAFNANIQTAYDLAANLAAGSQWAYTMRWKGQEGGTIRIAQGDLMVEPWNPVGGSNWVDDGMIQRATIDSGFMYDPYTGLIWPNMAESFKLVVEETRPVFQSDVSTGWASVEKVAEGSITVPADAWYDWDPATGKWITVGEAFPEGTTAITLGIVTYPADLYTTVKWHDGTPFSAADVVMNIFMTFAQCKPESPIYDESIVSNCESWFSHFKGVRITSVDPLVIETYDDLFTTDAELNATSWWPAEAGAYGYGGASWSMMALGNIMEAAGETAYTSAKSETLGVERVGFLTGPTLDVLNTHLDACIADAASCIEYPEVFGPFVTTEQAAAAFANLKAFYTTYGHMWIGTGPYFIDGVFPTEKVVTLKQNTEYPYLSDRWSNFGSPKIAVVEIDGDAQVTIGSEAVYDVYVTFEGAPYPANEIASVNWLLFNSAGELAAKAPATLVEDGHYQVTLGADVTGALAAGANKLEIAVGSKLVALPGLGAIEFVTVP